MLSTHAFIHSFDSWQDFVDYMTLYGAQIVILTFLSAVTVYRREMSCNRVFHQEQDESSSTLGGCCCEESNSNVTSERMECETEDLLDGAGLYCSGAPLLTIAAMWVECFAMEETTSKSSNTRSNNINKNNNVWDEDQPADLLERAGNYCSGEPILAAAALLGFQPSSPLSSKQSSTTITNTSEQHEQCHPRESFTKSLPPDVHIHIASFLHPKDVTSLACVDKFYRGFVDTGETSTALWKTLWQRDYAWIVHGWDVGQQALKRSNPTLIEYGKEFYFLFGHAYMNYVLAGQNTSDRCLVGLHGNIYDITAFLPSHPGSVDTLMVYSGRDASSFFEDMGHSMVARRLAKSFCVVVDESTSNNKNKDACGVHPTKNTASLKNGACTTPSISESRDILFSNRKKQQRRRHLATLKVIVKKYEKESERVRRTISRTFESNTSVVGEVNHYYDPFLQEWRVWYTNTNQQAVFTTVS